MTVRFDAPVKYPTGEMNNDDVVLESELELQRTNIMFALINAVEEDLDSVTTDGTNHDCKIIPFACEGECRLATEDEV